MQQPASDQAALEQAVYYTPNLQHNATVLSNIHTLSTAIAGAVAGILGLSGINGFVFFGAVWLVIVAAIVGVKTEGGKLNKFFMARTGVLTDNAFGALLSYVLFWTLFYALVHIYE
ncbi:transmembrane protein 93 [Ramicandelaber brevisporus]|nr:transmembrane protein 93 [Ramicandelaber brevisporus]